MTSALKFANRTPEQDAAYFEAMRLADEISRRQQREIGEDEFGRMYLGTLNRHMQEALTPVRQARGRYIALLVNPAKIIHPDGRVESMEPPRFDELDRLEAAIVERFTRGFR